MLLVICSVLPINGLLLRRNHDLRRSPWQGNTIHVYPSKWPAYKINNITKDIETLSASSFPSPLLLRDVPSFQLRLAASCCQLTVFSV